ncbi:hypothetical protein BE221DRAFT_75911, partial [Ostreococcus tauri]
SLLVRTSVTRTLARSFAPHPRRRSSRTIHRTVRPRTLEPARRIVDDAFPRARDAEARVHRAPPRARWW